MRRSSRRLGSLLLVALGCGDGAADDPFAGPVPAQCAATRMEQSLVVSRLLFIKATRPGVTDGFNLDGRVSTNEDASSCRRTDFTSPDGTTGVDNQLSLLVPVLETQTAGALDAAIQAAINSGQLMLGMSVEDLDDRRNDPCVRLVFRQLTGVPFVGSDQRIDPGQTFSVARDQPVSTVVGRMRDGVIEASGFSVALPIAVLDARFIINFRNARIRIRWRDDDHFEGMVGGGIPASELSAVVQTLGIPDSQRALFSRLINGITDMDPDAEGNCRLFSGAVSFEGRSAFVNP